MLFYEVHHFFSSIINGQWGYMYGLAIAFKLIDSAAIVSHTNCTGYAATAVLLF